MNASIRHKESSVADLDQCRTAVSDIYHDELEAVIVRNVVPPSDILRIRETFSNDSPEAEWSDPNAGFPGLGIRVLGTAATVCGTMPGGPETSDYFNDAGQRNRQLSALFGDDLNPMQKIIDVVTGLADNRPVALAKTLQGELFAPCTVRSLSAGEGILLHNDSHYQIAVYKDLLPLIDSSTCISFFVVLQNPKAGGGFCLYNLRKDDEGDLPRLPHGLLDPVEVDRLVEKVQLDLNEGDMIVFNAGQVYHRVEPVEGDQTRITIGGFMAFDRDHEQVHYWN